MSNQCNKKLIEILNQNVALILNTFSTYLETEISGAELFLKQKM